MSNSPDQTSGQVVTNFNTLALERAEERLIQAAAGAIKMSNAEEELIWDTIETQAWITAQKNGTTLPRGEFVQILRQRMRLMEEHLLHIDSVLRDAHQKAQQPNEDLKRLCKEFDGDLSEYEWQTSAQIADTLTDLLIQWRAPAPVDR